MHVELGGDLGQAIGHAGTAGDAVHEALGAFQNAGDDPLGAAHLPQDIGVDAALAAGDVIGLLGLGDAALDGVSDQLLMAVPAGAAMIDLRDRGCLSAS